MSSAYKFKRYKTEKPVAKEVKRTRNSTSNNNDKQYIEHFNQKIEQLLQDDPAFQKKAADILSQMINSKK